MPDIALKRRKGEKFVMSRKKSAFFEKNNIVNFLPHRLTPKSNLTFSQPNNINIQSVNLTNFSNPIAPILKHLIKIILNAIMKGLKTD